MKPNIIILCDGGLTSSTEDELDTYKQATNVLAALQRLGYEAAIHPFTNPQQLLLDCQRWDAHTLVFNLVENYIGAPFLHVVPLITRHCHIQCTGGDAASLFFSGDKVLAKQRLLSSGIATPPVVGVKGVPLEEFVGKNVIMKPYNQEGSVGISDESVFACSSIQQIEQLFAKAQKEHLMIEQYIEGDEFNISLMSVHGNVLVLPIAQIIFTDYPKGKPQIVNYKAKWEEDSFEYKNTNRSFDLSAHDPALIASLQTYAQSCWDIFGKCSYARVDMRVDREGTIWVLEININPSIAPDSGFIAACQKGGFSYDEVIELLVQEALDA